VYKAEIDGNEVILKELFMKNDKMRKIVLEEVKIISRINHPNIAHLNCLFQKNTKVHNIILPSSLSLFSFVFFFRYLLRWSLFLV